MPIVEWKDIDFGKRGMGSKTLDLGLAEQVSSFGTLPMLCLSIVDFFPATGEADL